MEEWNGIRKKNLVWNGKILVWNGYGMEEILQYGLWNCLPFHSIACPDGEYNEDLISVKLIGGRITIVDYPLLCFLPLHYNIAVLVAVMLLLSFFV